MKPQRSAALALLLTSLAAVAPVPAAGPPACDDDDGGLKLPEGFCALVVADRLGRARHLAVDADGDVYVALREAAPGGGTLALRDGDGDGRADVVKAFGDHPGTGIAIAGDELYVASDTAVHRYRLPEATLVPEGPPETVVAGFPRQRQHAAKAIALDGEGGLYVNVGAPSNACQRQTRTPGSPGMDPCPQRERQAGVWRFDARATGQRPGDGQRYGAGIRNAVALDWSPRTGALLVVQHGRDQLAQLWPQLYDEAQNARLPAEELLRVDPGDDFGWPYCYYDGQAGRRVLAPEYGGDGESVGRCGGFEPPLLAFPAHWAPNDLLLYTGDQFPGRYRGGAFVAFHGSWNRAPYPQQGYRVSFVPFEGGQPAGSHETFADGFAGAARIASPAQARWRPMGLAQGPDGSLYVSESVTGRIWRILYRGD